MPQSRMQRSNQKHSRTAQFFQKLSEFAQSWVEFHFVPDSWARCTKRARSKIGRDWTCHRAAYMSHIWQCSGRKYRIPLADDIDRSTLYGAGRDTGAGLLSVLTNNWNWGTVSMHTVTRLSCTRGPAPFTKDLKIYLKKSSKFVIKL